MYSCLLLVYFVDELSAHYTLSAFHSTSHTVCVCVRVCVCVCACVCVLLVSHGVMAIIYTHK